MHPVGCELSLSRLPLVAFFTAHEGKLRLYLLVPRMLNWYVCFLPQVSATTVAIRGSAWNHFKNHVFSLSIDLGTL